MSYTRVSFPCRPHFLQSFPTSARFPRNLLNPLPGPHVPIGPGQFPIAALAVPFVVQDGRTNRAGSGNVGVSSGPSRTINLIICIRGARIRDSHSFLRGQHCPSATSHYRLGRRLASHLSPSTRLGFTFSWLFDFVFSFFLCSFFFFLLWLSWPAPTFPNVSSRWRPRTSPMAPGEAAPPPEIAEERPLPPSDTP